jgi:hypothetical protein
VAIFLQTFLWANDWADYFMPREWESRFEHSGNVTCVVDASAKIVYCNPAWDAFARKNGGERATSQHVLGKSFLEHIPAVLRPHYEQMFKKAAAERRIVSGDYDCNAPKLFRRYRVMMMPLGGTELTALVHALQFEYPVSEAEETSTREDSGAAVSMCAQCRRVEFESGEWLWVPDFARLAPSGISQGLCPACDKIY